MKLLRIVAIVFALGLLPACTAAPEKTTAECGQSPAILEPHKNEYIALSLPAGSRLTAENTYDARYWTWQTDVGGVSVTGVADYAREVYAPAHAAACMLDAKNARFKVYFQPRSRKIVAISNALTPNGAGLIVKFETSNAEATYPVALEILRSIQVSDE